MLVFNYKPKEPEIFSYYFVKDGENYEDYIIKNPEYSFILVNEIPAFSLLENLYPVVDKITSINELGHRTGTLKLVPHVQTEEQIKANIRANREEKCFPIINRGQLWYDTLTEAQHNELAVWYRAWLDATETMVEPDDLDWVKLNIEG